MTDDTLVEDGHVSSTAAYIHQYHTRFFFFIA